MTARRSLQWSDGAAGPVLETAADWRLRAVCTPADDPVMFPPFGAGSAEAVGKAKAICQPCPVRGECLRYALAHPRISEHGVWGGLTANERRDAQAGPPPATDTGDGPKKKCCRCGHSKPLDAFYRRADAPDGRQSRCKHCEERDRMSPVAA
jgi:WhiB family redox-sensing transcriptional regulator